MPPLPVEYLVIAASVVTSVVVAGAKGLWVWGRELTGSKTALKEMTVDRNFWRDAALKSMGHTDRATTAAVEVAEIAKQARTEGA